MDYGIISLLVIQLAACAGTLFAWMSMRHEADRLTSGTAKLDTQVQAIAGRVVETSAGIDRCSQRMEKVEDVAGHAEEVALHAQKVSKEALEASEAWTDEAKSIRASIMALRRWARNEEGGESPLPAADPAEENLPPPPLQPGKRSTFGVKAV